MPEARQRLAGCKARGNEAHLAEINAILAALGMSAEPTYAAWRTFVGEDSAARRSICPSRQPCANYGLEVLTARQPPVLARGGWLADRASAGGACVVCVAHPSVTLPITE
jgi:hypothetical protein